MHRLNLPLIRYAAALLCIGWASSLLHSAEPSAGTQPEILSVEKVWDRSPHNGFPDMIRYKDKFYLTFREADSHIRGNGILPVLESSDGKTWTEVATLREEGIDLREMKFSIMPDGRLMGIVGCSDYAGTNLGPRTPEFPAKLKSLQTHVTFSTDGRTWTKLQPILKPGLWLWRAAWHAGRAYGVAYPIPFGSTDATLDLQENPLLVSSDDGVNWQTVCTLDVPGGNETAIQFLPDGEMLLLMRRAHQTLSASIGTSKPPYKDWKWTDAKYFVGGPNIIMLPNGEIWSGGRDRREFKLPKTAIARMTRDSYEPVVTLPSAKDNGYPGFVWHDGLLWVAYYSKHEGDKANIFIAKIKLPETSN